MLCEHVYIGVSTAQSLDHGHHECSQSVAFHARPEGLLQYICHIRFSSLSKLHLVLLASIVAANVLVK